jgi:bacteriocin biosynthesis cyclodehydratase domain-containing protein
MATPVPAEPVFGRQDPVSAILLQDTLYLAVHDALMEVEGEHAALVFAVLSAMALPARRSDIQARCGDFDSDLVDEALDFLTDAEAIGALSADWMQQEGISAGDAEEIHAALGVGETLFIRSSLISVEEEAAHGVFFKKDANHAGLFIEDKALWFLPSRRIDGPCISCLVMRRLAHLPGVHFRLRQETKKGGAQTLFAQVLQDEVGAAARAFENALDEKSAPKLPAGWSRTFRFDRRQGHVSEHILIRTPHCPACGSKKDPSLPSMKDGAAASKEKKADHWRDLLKGDEDQGVLSELKTKVLLDQEVGLINLNENRDHIKDYIWQAPILWGGIHLLRENNHISTPNQGINGTGPDLDHMRLVCLSEGTERYALATHLPDVFEKSESELGREAFPSGQITQYQKEQVESPGFPLKPYSKDAPRDWSWAYGLLSQEARLFPYELVATSLNDIEAPNRMIHQIMSSGGASHISYRRAIINALRELIERDAHMMAWYKGLDLERVKLPSKTGDDYVDGLLDYLKKAGVELAVFDLRVDFEIPTFLTLMRVPDVRGNLEPGGCTVVATADLDPLSALGRGLCETAIHYETLALTPAELKNWRNHPYSTQGNEQGWTSWWPLYLHYLNPKNGAIFDDEFKKKPTIKLDAMASFATDDSEVALDGLLKQFKARNLEPWVVDLVNKELSSLPFRVVKVIIPGFNEITAGFQSRRLNLPRLEAIAKKWSRAHLGPGEFRTEPHPNA